MSEILINISRTNLRMRRGHVVFGEVLYTPGGVCGPRVQRDYQLVVLHRGEVDLHLDDRRIHLAAPQSILLSPQHWEHFLFSREHEVHHSWCSIDAKAVPKKLRHLFRSSCKPIPVHSHTHLLMEFGKTLSFAGQPESDIENSFYLNLGLALLTSHALSVQANIGAARPGEQALSRAKHFILTEFGRNLSLEHIASAVNVSKPQLLKLFRNFIGTSPIQYLYEQRLSAAAEKLAHTGLPIKEIARACGFANEFHFSRKFKKAYGESPRVWRQQQWSGTEDDKSDGKF